MDANVDVLIDRRSQRRTRITPIVGRIVGSPSKKADAYRCLRNDPLFYERFSTMLYSFQLKGTQED